MISDIDYLFIYLFAIHISSLVKYLFKYLPIFYWFVYLFIINL